MLAQWSEVYFNNRALFSDYYLQERLTDPKITPAWDEDVRPAGREIYKHIVTARKDYTRQTADVICKRLYEPVFKLLGFDFAQQKSGASSAGKADYLLYTPGDKSKPIAAALTYVWNRNLDDVDESRERAEDDGGTPFKIPGAMVVSLLEAQVAPLGDRHQRQAVAALLIDGEQQGDQLLRNRPGRSHCRQRPDYCAEILVADVPAAGVHRLPR